MMLEKPTLSPKAANRQCMSQEQQSGFPAFQLSTPGCTAPRAVTIFAFTAVQLLL